MRLIMREYGKRICVCSQVLFKFLNLKKTVKCQLSDYVFLRRVPRCTIIAKISNLHQKVGYRQDYKCRKLHADTQ